MGNSIAFGRLMTLPEKHCLRKLIRDLPPKNLDRVAQIICRAKHVEKHTCSEVHVDLENEVYIYFSFAVVCLIFLSSQFSKFPMGYCRTKQHSGDCISTLKQLRMLRNFARCNTK